MKALLLSVALIASPLAAGEAQAPAPIPPGHVLVSEDEIKGILLQYQVMLEQLEATQKELRHWKAKSLCS